MVAKDKNILLFVDNASCHKINFKPRNIEIEFLPPNTIALIQPLDQGIIHAFKAEYRKILVRKQISAIERGVPLQTYIKSISILDVLHYIKRAWWLVKPETICNCFKKAGICNTNADVVSCEVELGILEEIPNTEEYIHCDDELQCRGLLTDEQIVANLCDVPSSEISSGDENSEENHDVSKATSVKEALSALNTLETFFMENPMETNFKIFEMEEMIVKFAKTKKVSQSKITSYFS
ncbi:tigger transposable element-derived protein 6-like [Anastrepha ludens]|uniref:tigger transposable element-derived protein 6-like n=1 Tax=Anastrepha ludens TaxID=28586 RepID=UPI0023B1774C|nr:tigger transposable element-derived protein 6-like [Anastrepha ludens]